MMRSFTVECPYMIIECKDYASGHLITYKHYKETNKKEEVARRPLTEKEMKAGEKLRAQKKAEEMKKMKEKKKAEEMKKMKEKKEAEERNKGATEAVTKKVKPPSKKRKLSEGMDYKSVCTSLIKKMKVLEKQCKSHLRASRQLVGDKEERLKKVTRLLEEHKKREKILFDAVQNYVDTCDRLVEERDDTTDDDDSL